MAYSILETVVRQCKEENFTRILEVRLRIGQGSGVLADSLKFAFDICKKDTPAHDAEMIIEPVPMGGDCTACGQHFVAESRHIFSCPHCRSNSFTITQGFETQIIDMEVE